MIKELDLLFLKYARIQSKHSDDKTKIGTCLTTGDINYMIGGWNHLPFIFEPDVNDKYLNNRDLKNRFIIHAEVDVLTKALTSYVSYNFHKYNKLYIWGLHSCARCAGFVANLNNVTSIVSVDALTTNDPHKWNEEATIAQQIYKDSSIEVEHWEKNEFDSYLNEIDKIEWFYAD